MTDADGADWPPLPGSSLRKMSDRDLLMDAFFPEDTERITLHGRKKEMNKSLVETYRRRAEELEAKAILIESFGNNEEYPTGSVIYFQRTFDRGDRSRNRKLYTYAAVKADNGFWYCTGRTSSISYSWEKLVEDFLIPASEETGEIWFATRWVKLL